MTEKERRKKIRQRKEARSRVLRLRCLVFFVILGLAAAAVLIGLTRNRGQAAAEKEMSVQVPDMPEEVNTEPVPEMLDLTGDIRKQGGERTRGDHSGGVQGSLTAATQGAAGGVHGQTYDQSG